MIVVYPNLCYNELCYKGTILQRDYRKRTILWSFSYNSFKKNMGATKGPCHIQICVIMSYVIKGQFYEGIIGK